MDDPGGFALAICASIVGFACLALAMPRHWTQVTGDAEHSPRRRRLLRATGFLALFFSLASALLTQGAGFGSLLWVLALTIGAAAVALTLAWRAEWLRPLAGVIRAMSQARRPGDA